MADARVIQFRGRAGGKTARVVQFRGRAAATTTARVVQFRGRASSDALSVNAGADQAGIEPFAVQDLTAVVANTLPATTVWTQTGGPAVTLVGSGKVVQYVTPGTRAGVVLTFQVTSTTTGGATATDTVTHTVLSHGGPWLYVGGALVAVGINPPTI